MDQSYTVKGITYSLASMSGTKHWDLTVGHDGQLRPQLLNLFNDDLADRVERSAAMQAQAGAVNANHAAVTALRAEVTADRAGVAADRQAAETARTQAQQAAAGAQAAVGGVRVSGTDTTATALVNKLVAGAGVTITLVNAGGNEQLSIAASGGVASFAGRAGAVVPQAGDYTAAQVGALPIGGGQLTGPVQAKPMVAVAAVGNVFTPDLAVGQDFEMVLAANSTLAFPANVKAGAEGSIVIKQNATGGFTLALAAGYVAPGGLSTLSFATTANAKNRLDFWAESAGTIHLGVGKDIKP